MIGTINKITQNKDFTVTLQIVVDSDERDIQFLQLGMINMEQRKNNHQLTLPGEP